MNKDWQLVVLLTACEFVAVGNLLEINVGIVEQRAQNISLDKGTETSATEVIV